MAITSFTKLYPFESSLFTMVEMNGNKFFYLRFFVDTQSDSILYGGSDANNNDHHNDDQYDGEMIHAQTTVVTTIMINMTVR